MSLKSLVEKRSLAVIATFCVMVACGGKSEPAATKKAPSSAPASGSSTTSEKTAQKSDAPTPTPTKGSDSKTAPSPTTPAVPGATKAAPAKKALGALRHIPKTALAVAVDALATSFEQALPRRLEAV